MFCLKMSLKTAQAGHTLMKQSCSTTPSNAEECVPVLNPFPEDLCGSRTQECCCNGLGSAGTCDLLRCSGMKSLECFGGGCTKVMGWEAGWSSFSGDLLCLGYFCMRTKATELCEADILCFTSTDRQ